MAGSKEAPSQPGMTQQIQLFTSADGQAQLPVALEHDTVWLSQAQVGQLFDTTPENVLMHLKKIVNDEELLEQATTKDFLVVRQERARQVRRRIKQEALASWAVYQETGRHLTGPEVRTWLSTWGTEDEKAVPECHK